MMPAVYYCRFKLADRDESYKSSMEYANRYIECENADEDKKEELKKYLAEKNEQIINMTDAETTDSLTALSIKLAPVLSEHEDNISLNEKLFKRVNDVYQQKDSLNLTTEQKRLLDKTYKQFVRSGANLSAEKQARLREINKELSTLGITFSNNVLNENNAYQLFVEKE